MVTILASLLPACEQGPNWATSDDQQILRAVFEERCARGSFEAIGSRPFSYDVPANAGPIFHHDIDMSYRREGDWRWRAGTVCSGIKVIEGDSLTRASIPVYSPDGQRALVYVDYDCGAPLCGYSMVYDVWKLGDRWKLVNTWQGTTS